MISSFTVFLLIAQIIIAVTTPLVFFAILRFRRLTNWAPFAAGFFVYLISFPLEAVVSGYLFSKEEATTGILINNPFLCVVVSGLVAIVFGELVRFIVFRYIVKESNRRHEGLSYGAGYSLVEVAISSFFGAFVPAMYAGLINEAGPDAFIESIEDHEAARGVVEVMNQITDSAIILDILNILFVIITEIALSMICFYAVKKNSLQFIGLACALEFLYNIPNALVTCGQIRSGTVKILSLLPLMLLIVYVAARLFKDYDKKAVYPDIKTFFGIGGRRLGQE